MGIVGQRKTSPRQTRTSITGLFRLGGDTPSCNGDPRKIRPISGPNANLDVAFFFLLHYINGIVTRLSYENVFYLFFFFFNSMKNKFE